MLLRDPRNGETNKDLLPIICKTLTEQDFFFFLPARQLEAISVLG